MLVFLIIFKKTNIFKASSKKRFFPFLSALVSFIVSNTMKKNSFFIFKRIFHKFNFHASRVKLTKNE